MVSSADTPVLRAFLFADPAAHSLSPVMHRAAFAAAGLRGDYEARRVTATDLSEAVASLRQPGRVGANVSLPHKSAVTRLVDELTEAARAIGAVNTIVRNGDRLVGDNTDAPGLLSALAESDVRPGPTVVLGAGGAARAAVWALRRAGHDVWVVGRTPARAAVLAEEFGVRSAETDRVPWPEVTLVVNATSAGLDAPDETPLPRFPALRAGAFVYDMVYRPARTRLMRDARERGLRAENGLSMLAHQASLSFRAWTGASVSPTVFARAAQLELQAHGERED